MQTSTEISDLSKWFHNTKVQILQSNESNPFDIFYAWKSKLIETLFNEITPILLKSFHRVDSLLRKARTMSGVTPFGQMILTWRLCLHASISARHSSSRMMIESLSSLMTGWGSCDEGMSHKLVRAWAKSFACFWKTCVFLGWYLGFLKTHPWNFWWNVGSFCLNVGFFLEH